MDQLLNTVVWINGALSDYVLIILLLGVGLFFTLRTGFVQLRYFGAGMKKVFSGFSLSGGSHGGGLSSFQALATAIAAQVGTGNIVGACGAIMTGGPGAIFWMWIIAFFGMATIYAEAVLAQKTRVTDANGEIHGGPVYYITTAFKGGLGKFLAGFFAIAIIFALGFTGCMVQSNSMASTLSTATGIEPWIIGAIVAVVAAFIFLGGVQRIASVTEKIVPLMALLYIIGCLVLIVMNLSYVGEAIAMIFKYAFTPEAIIGGTFGSAIKIALSQGAKRGLFSNEAGMGSTPHAHAIAQVKTPHDQGVVAMIGVFIDTFIVLTMTALVVISFFYAKNPEVSAIMADGSGASWVLNGIAVNKTNMAQLAFAGAFGEGAGSLFVAICLMFFAFSTIVGWHFFGRVNAQYLFGKAFLPIYAIISIAFIFLGSLMSNDLVWELSDMFNQLMVLPNVLALFALGAMVCHAIPKKGEQKKD